MVFQPCRQKGGCTRRGKGDNTRLTRSGVMTRSCTFGGPWVDRTADDGPASLSALGCFVLWRWALALSAKQRAFVEYYLQCWNATEAARRAGYSEKTAYAQGHRLLKNAEIQAAIEARLKELKMSADEVLVRLSDQARGTMKDFVNADLQVIDLESAKAASKLHLIKRFSRTTSEKSDSVTIELYDAQAALVQLGRAHGLFKDVTEANITGITQASADDWAAAWLEAQRELEQWKRERFGSSDTDGD